MIFDRANYITEPLPIEEELKTLFKQDEVLTIFEIGACEGEDSIRYALLFPSSKIYAFEPLASNIKLIENNLRQYNINNVSYYNKALSTEEGVAEFYVSEGRPENVPDSDWNFGNKSSSLLQPHKHLETTSFIKFNNKIEVETTTINSFCRANNITVIDFIHMDVQGAELMVLEGAGDLISSIKAIWLEVSKIHLYKDQPLVDEVKEFMYKNNFVLIKDALESFQGDHLYLSKTFYADYKKLKGRSQESSSLISRILKKLGIELTA